MDSHGHALGNSEEGTPRLVAVPDLAGPRGLYPRVVKPFVDVIAGVVLSVLSLPLLLAISGLILVSMGRPAFFIQPRVGRRGRLFRVYKFRTMMPDRRLAPSDRRSTSRAGELDRRRTHKSRKDPRVTRIGAFLRKWSLDELPQVWNVALGQMSLVGPRPELVELVAAYEPWQHERHVVKPGITGLWQVSARGNVPMHEATELDIEYVRAQSALLDLKILLVTVPAALGKRRGF